MQNGIQVKAEKLHTSGTQRIFGNAMQSDPHYNLCLQQQQQEDRLQSTEILQPLQNSIESFPRENHHREVTIIMMVSQHTTNHLGRFFINLSKTIQVEVCTAQMLVSGSPN